MASSWESLPKELLKAIFTNSVVRAQDLQLQLTCKSWNKVAKEIRYHQLHISQFTTRSSVEKLIESLQQPNNEARHIVKQFNLCDASHAQDLATTILSLCPNLTTLFGSELNQEATETLLDALYLLRSGGLLQRLEIVRLPLYSTDSGQLEEKYNRAMLKCRPYNAPPQHFIEALDRLAEFPRLKALKITLECITYLYEVDSFIQKLDRKIDTLTICLQNDRVLQPLESVNYSNIMPRPHMKKLNINIDKLRAEDLEYIMNKFPELESLEVHFIGDTNEVPASLTLDTTNSLNIMARFLEYLVELPSYVLDWITIPTTRLRPTLSDIKKYIHITELTISDAVPAIPNTHFCLLPRNATDRYECSGYMFLLTRQQQQQRKSLYEYALDLMKEDIRQLTLECAIEDADPEDEGVRQEHTAACKDQGDAVVVALNTLPFLKSLSAENAVITTIAPSTTNPTSSKLKLEKVTFGTGIHPDAYFEMSRRISHVKIFTIDISYGGNQVDSRGYFINMPHTTFGDIRIKDSWGNHCITKLYTPSGITYHGFGGTSVTLSKDDYDNWTPSAEKLTKVTICCARVRTISHGEKTIDIESNQETRFIYS
ncbi:hypothetical protein MBANPS3_008375 [Mucor bainieri]